ncbi:MAG: radical SAM family heme chaperone HemW [Prevotellaceae bacterium]|nr:radical SAM family heme chaperone HemW [Prevotellaceae bacterium]
MTGVYIHIPFCKSRCAYCDFVSTTLGKDWQLGYVEALGREMARRREENGEPRASTVYIGGGTPSQLCPEALRGLTGIISRGFTFADNAEFTFEVNPDDVSAGLVARLRDTAVNRISMGVQSLDDKVLRFLRRRHSASQALRAIDLLLESGYTNLSVDLMYSIPGQGVGGFAQDVRTVLATGVPHLSAYDLQWEQGTPLYNMLQDDKVRRIGERVSEEEYASLRRLTAEAGMEHYEISNFALPGFRSRHNSSYWNGTPYLGFGAGAHSYDGGSVRSMNTANVSDYISGRGKTVREELSESERYNERVMLSLRTSDGLSLSLLCKDFGERRLAYCLRQARSHLTSGVLEMIGKDTMRLTADGLFISNYVISDLMLLD